MFIIIIKIIRYVNLKTKKRDTPFECGVNSFFSVRKLFSLKFFILTLIFLMFDIEIILLMPIIYNDALRLNNISVLVFLFSLGFIVEWIFQSLE